MPHADLLRRGLSKLLSEPGQRHVVPSGYDAVVIGAGHNGLTCGCYLAKAGLKVLVLEQYSEIGGVTISEEMAAPGFLSDIHASGYLVAKLTPAPQQLGLAAHGLELITPDPNWAQVFPDGKALAIGRDLEMTVKSFAQFSAKDGETWRALYHSYLVAKPAITAGMNAPPPSLAAEFAGAADRPLPLSIPERAVLGGADLCLAGGQEFLRLLRAACLSFT